MHLAHLNDVLELARLEQATWRERLDALTASGVPLNVAGIESGVGRTWVGNQAALGTKALVGATSTLSLRQATEDHLKSNKTHGREPYVDGAAYDSSTPYVENVGGDVGNLVTHGLIETTAAMWARHVGVDVVTGAADPWTHTIATGTANPTYQTLRHKVGVNVGPYRAGWWDAIHNKLTWNCGQDQNIGRLTTAMLALKAAEIEAADPATADPGTDPWRWGEAAGAVTINAVAFPEVSGETLEADRGWGVWMGDNMEPVCFLPGRGAITRTFSAIVSDTMLPQLLLLLYGSTTPVAGTRPTAQPSFGALKTVYTRSVSRTLTKDTPKVELKPDDLVIAAAPQGGAREVVFGGQAMAGASPSMTVTAKTGDSVSYVL